jgi:hypothetical protein
MKKLIFVSFAFALLMSVAALAQDAAQPGSAPASAQAQDQKPMNHPLTMTGCLQKGDQPGQVSLAGADGKSWDLQSDSVKLDQHIGHQVTVTGTATRETKAEEKKDGQVEKASSKEEYGNLSVTTLKMVSETCAK